MPHRHRRLTAWLGILAICLVIVVPLISQWRASKAADVEAIGCSGHRHDDTAETHHALHFRACGYCHFFARLPVIGGTPTAALELTAVFSDTVAPSPDFAARITRFRHAYPRAPPETA
ncbi:MAG: DUF2946 family protein [Burkholderiales bacterium]|nr:DUF2946 family protein [Burkholderiales bacterium]